MVYAVIQNNRQLVELILENSDKGLLKGHVDNFGKRIEDYILNSPNFT